MREERSGGSLVNVLGREDESVDYEVAGAASPFDDFFKGVF